MAEDTAERPLCKCHSLPMHRNGHEPTGTQKWRCPVDGCVRSRGNYWRLSGIAYSRRLLQIRRSKALGRIAEREERRGPLQEQG